MRAEIIAVGSEMLTPDNLDTNSLFITEKLNEVGFQVHFKTVVGDDEQDIVGVLRSALQRSRVIIVTGGLGPTEDDLTRRSVAAVLGREVRIDAGIVEKLRQRFASRGYSMPSINERQAEVIEGAEVLANTTGTAPGMWLVENGVGIALLPGPPREARPMLEKSVIPRVAALGNGRTLARKTIHITGWTESEVDARVAPIYRSYPNIQTTILAGTGQISLRLFRWLEPGENPSDLDRLSAAICDALGSAVFSASGEPLEEVVGRNLLKEQLTVAVAESCTAGLLGALITRVPGSSAWFRGGALCYSNELKISFCGVPEELIAAHGAVSAEVAEALARGIRSRTGSSIGLSITGIAGPAGGSAEKPVGLVYVGVANDRCTIHARRIVPGDRQTVRERAAYFALAILRNFLLTPGGSAPSSSR
jgi:nicotinamide-nucleotide amidase